MTTATLTARERHVIRKAGQIWPHLARLSERALSDRHGARQARRVVARCALYGSIAGWSGLEAQDLARLAEGP